MDRNDIFNYIQSIAPQGIQFVNPYQDEVPLPESGDFVMVNVMNVQDVGLAQYKTVAFDDKNGNIDLEYYQERIYPVQFDCFGKNAQVLAMNLKAVIKDFFYNNINTPFNIKTVTDIENLTELLENKRYCERYSFRIEFFVMDTREEKNEPALLNIKPELAIIVQ